MERGPDASDHKKKKKKKKKKKTDPPSRHTCIDVAHARKDLRSALIEVVRLWVARGRVCALKHHGAHPVAEQEPAQRQAHRPAADDRNTSCPREAEHE
jgi:hypothetical protein